MNETIRDTLKEVCVKHSALFLELYGNLRAKPKIHHVFHIADDMFYFLSCLSCFPTERKNKDAIAVSVATDRTVEKTSVIKFLHRTLKHWERVSTACTKMFLARGAAICVDGRKITKARYGVFPCGEVHCGDMVAFYDGSLGRVQQLLETEGVIYIGASIHRKLAGKFVDWELESHEFNFIDARLMQEPVAWYARSQSIVAAAPVYSESI